MDKEHFYNWKQHPVTQEFFELLRKEQAEMVMDVINTLNLSDPDPVKLACNVAYLKGHCDRIQEIFDMKGEDDEHIRDSSG